tara:strand:- start:37218 stop:37670 length:453 start_codon:yes stop_codon:yes gene_type:complete
MNILALTEADVKDGINYIYEQLLDQGWIPHKIIGIQMGGLTPALMLAKKFNMKTIDTIKMNNSYPLHYDLPILDRKILIVDDIADSGETLNNVMRTLLIMDKNDEYEFATAVLVHKSHTSAHSPEYAGQTTETNSWVQFPWEWNEETEEW